MKRVNTDTLNPIEVYYRVEYSSKAEEIFDAFIKKNDDILTEMRNAANAIKPIPDAEPLMGGGRIFAFAIPRDAEIPDGYRRAKKNSREDSYFNGMTVIYPNLKKAGGKALLQAVRDIPELPETTELVRDFGFGYEGFLIIGNRLYRSLGYFRKPGNNAYVQANVFIDKSGKFYHGSSDALIDKLPLVEGLTEVMATEFFAQKGKADEKQNS